MPILLPGGKKKVQVFSAKTEGLSSWKSSKYTSKTTSKLHFAVENNICMHKSGQSHSLKKKQTSLKIWQVTVTWDTTKIKCFTESSLHIAVDWLGYFFFFQTIPNTSSANKLLKV